MKDYGLIESLQELGAYILGDGNVPFIPYQEDGNWEPFLPKYESQSDRYETLCCTVFGTQNAIETLYKRLYGIEPNYSERYTALLSGLKGTKGTDPQIPCEAIRKEGLVDQEVMPMTRKKEEFFDMTGLTGSIRAKGQNWLVNHLFQHDWVWKGKKPANYKELLKEALQTSPLGVSVYAWDEENGVYVSKGDKNNHWCMLYKIDEEGYPWVFDSYSHEKKRLSKDHNIKQAKRFHLLLKTNKGVSSLVTILEEILKRLKLMKPTFFDVCKSALGTDASPNDEAPDELACANTVTELMRKVYPETPKINGTWTLWEYLKKNWAEVKTYEPGTIIISPTGTGTGTGHAGVVMEDGLIASNNSFGPNKGKFTINYTRETWNSKYAVKQKMPVYLYRPIIK